MQPTTPTTRARNKHDEEREEGREGGAEVITPVAPLGRNARRNFGVVAAPVAVSAAVDGAGDEESGDSSDESPKAKDPNRRLCRTEWFDPSNKKYKPWLYLKQRDGCLGCKACMWAGAVRSQQDQLSKGNAKDTLGNYPSNHEKHELHKTNVRNFISVVCQGDEGSFGATVMPGDRDRDGRVIIGAKPASAIALAASRRPGVIVVFLRRQISRNYFLPFCPSAKMPSEL